MLVFSVKVDDRIVVGERGDILFIILANNRIGVEAPRDVPIDRWKVRQSVLRHGRRRKLG